MKMQDCTQFDHCSAPICPLDPNWRVCKHLNGEPVCLWLREYAKDPDMGNLSSSVHTELAPQVAECYREVFASVGYSDIRTRLTRAAKSPSKIKQYKERFK